MSSFTGDSASNLPDLVPKPGEQQTSAFIGPETTGQYRVEELDPQPQHLVEAILNEKPLMNRLQTESDREDYIAAAANNQGNIPGAEMFLHNSKTSGDIEPRLSLLESIKRSKIAHKSKVTSKRKDEDDGENATRRSIKRDLHDGGYDVKNFVNKKAKVKLKRTLLRALKKTEIISQ